MENEWKRNRNIHRKRNKEIRKEGVSREVNEEKRKNKKNKLKGNETNERTE